MTDRIIVYPGEIPTDAMFLNTNQNMMVALGFLAQATLGSGTVADGLACIATTPASLAVLVGPGSIYSVESLEATAYGSLSADTTDQIVKQGIILGNTSFNITPPSTSGQSRVYLVQAEYQDVDAGATVLPYYNAANPAVPYSGPANAGTNQNTIRKGACVLSLKAGTAAATGSQATPTPDAGYVGLWAITVANGATTIISANIAQYPGAPFLKAKLPSLPASIRPQITANTTWYVATTGSDSNTGLSASAPFLTIQKAVNAVQALDLNGFTATISVADGTYMSGFSVNGPIIGGNLQVTGDVTNPSNCVISTTGANCIAGNNNAIFSVAGFSLASSGTGYGIGALTGSTIYVNGNMTYASVAQSVMTASDHGKILISAGYTITTSTVTHWDAERYGEISVVSPITVTITGSPTWSTAFAVAINFGLILAQASMVTFSGAANGQRYSAASNGLIETNGGGATFFPGSASGVIASQGQYL